MRFHGVAQAVDALQRGVTGGIVSNGISRTGDVIVNGAGNADNRDTTVSQAEQTFKSAIAADAN